MLLCCDNFLGKRSGVLESPGEVVEFFGIKRVGTLFTCFSYAQKFTQRMLLMQQWSDGTFFNFYPTACFNARLIKADILNIAH